MIESLAAALGCGTGASGTSAALDSVTVACTVADIGGLPSSAAATEKRYSDFVSKS